VFTACRIIHRRCCLQTVPPVHYCHVRLAYNLFLRNCQVPYLLYNKEFLCITVERNYISPSSTVGIQLHVSALHVGHLQVVI
jgi:hypothetical protein